MKVLNNLVLLRQKEANEEVYTILLLSVASFCKSIAESMVDIGKIKYLKSLVPEGARSTFSITEKIGFLY